VYRTFFSWLESDADVNEAAGVDARAHFARELDRFGFGWEERHLSATFEGRRALKVTVTAQELESRCREADDWLATPESDHMSCEFIVVVVLGAQRLSRAVKVRSDETI
jgi:hypothetical protein